MLGQYNNKTNGGWVQTEVHNNTSAKYRCSSSPGNSPHISVRTPLSLQFHPLKSFLCPFGLGKRSFVGKITTPEAVGRLSSSPSLKAYKAGLLVWWRKKAAALLSLHSLSRWSLNHRSYTIFFSSAFSTVFSDRTSRVRHFTSIPAYVAQVLETVSMIYICRTKKDKERALEDENHDKRA